MMRLKMHAVSGNTARLRLSHPILHLGADFPNISHDINR
jgi:hypothetical protein